MQPFEVVLLSGAFTLVGSFVAWWLARREKRDERKHSARTPTPPTTQEVWQRLDHVERVVRSAVYVLSEVAEQWPEGYPQPVLSRRHVAILAEEGYLPPEWEPKTDDRGGE